MRSGSSGGERSFGIWKDGEGLLAGTRRERNPPTHTQTSSLRNTSVDPSRSAEAGHLTMDIVDKCKNGTKIIQSFALVQLNVMSRF